MTPEDWRQALRVFAEVYHLSSSVQDGLLEDHLCDHSPVIREAVIRLLQSHRKAEEELFLQVPLGAVNFSFSLPTLQPGQHVRQYEIVSEIGHGSMGDVYRATHLHIKHTVALKVIRPDLVSYLDGSTTVAEIITAGSLDHPYIAKVHDAGFFDMDEDSFPFVTMDLVQGLHLDAYQREHRPSIRDVLQLMQRICEGVAYAHARKIVHCDLKPRNIMVDKSGTPKILDFGVAQIIDADARMALLNTADSPFGGTKKYMSPEHTYGDPRKLDFCSDVYSLGVMLYELLVDRPPYELNDLQTTIAFSRIREATPVRLGTLDKSIGDDVEAIVSTALSKEPQSRYRDAGALADDIRRFLDNAPVEAKRPWRRRYLAAKAIRRNKVAAVGTAATIVALLLGLLTTSWYWRQAEMSRKAAEERTLLARRHAYAAHMKLAEQALLHRDLARVQVLLDAEVPASGIEDLRGFEWYYLWRICHNPPLREIRSEIPVNGVVAARDGAVGASLVGRGAALIDLNTGKLRLRLDGHSDSIARVDTLPSK